MAAYGIPLGDTGPAGLQEETVDEELEDLGGWLQVVRVFCPGIFIAWGDHEPERNHQAIAGACRGTRSNEDHSTTQQL